MVGHVTNVAGGEGSYNVSKFTDVRHETAPLIYSIMRIFPSKCANCAALTLSLYIDLVYVLQSY